MSVFSQIADAATDVANFGLQLANQRYMRDVQAKTWEREDTAVQRRVEDLKAAGLSPVLAAGSAAQTSGPIRADAPQIDFSFSEKEKMAQDIAASKATVGMTQAQADIARSEAYRRKLETSVLQRLATSEYGPNGDSYEMYQAKRQKQLADNEIAVSDYSRETAKANMENAKVQAAANNRAYQFDLTHNLFGATARERQADSTWLNSARLKDLSGPAAQAAYDVLGRIIGRRK